MFKARDKWLLFLLGSFAALGVALGQSWLHKATSADYLWVAQANLAEYLVAVSTGFWMEKVTRLGIPRSLKFAHYLLALALYIAVTLSIRFDGGVGIAARENSICTTVLGFMFGAILLKPTPAPRAEKSL